MRTVGRQRLPVVIADHVLAVAHHVAVVVAGVTDADRKRVPVQRRQLLLREVAFDLGRIGRLGVGRDRVGGIVPALRVVVHLGVHPGVLRVRDRDGLRQVRAGLARPGRVRVLRARVFVPVVDVALGLVGSALEVEDQVHLRLARARRKYNFAHAERLDVQAQVFLYPAERRRVVVLRHRRAGRLQLFPRVVGDWQLLTGEVALALAIWKAQDRRAGIAFDGRLGAAVGDARVRVRDRARHPNVTRNDREVCRVRHEPAAGADLIVSLLDRVREVARAALGLRVPHVCPRADDAVGEHLVVAAEVGAFGASDVALAPDEVRSEVALDVSLRRREVVGRDQVVAVVRLGMLAVVDEDRDRLPARHLVEAHHGDVEVGAFVGHRLTGELVGIPGR